MIVHQTVARVFNQAAREGWAVGAFNAANLETIKAIAQAAVRAEAPVIIESSPGETDFAGAAILRSAVDWYREQLGAVIFLNLDHAVSLEQTMTGIGARYDLIHFDGGRLSFEENVSITRTIVREARQHQLMVEGELEHIAGSSDDHRATSSRSIAATITLTDPEQAREFVKRTGVNTLAVSIGNVHGLYREPPTLQLDRLKAIHDTVEVYLSLHGGSGIRDLDVRHAIDCGITKINVNSELRVAFLSALQQAVKRPSEIAAYKFMTPVIAAVQDVVEQKIKLFGSGGKAKRQWSRTTIA